MRIGRTGATRELRNGSALVTGASRGLGLLLAARVAQRGNTVTLVARDEGELDRAARWIRDHTGRTPSVRVCDVRDAQRVAATVEETARRQGGLDAVFANAGVIQVAPLQALEPADFRTTMDVMFHGCVHTALAALPSLRQSPVGGRLVLTGSIGGLLAVPHLVPYSCAKAAVASLAEGLSAELSGSDVSVTAAHPGLMRTGSHRQAEFGGRREAEFAWFSALSGTPLLSMDAERAAERVVRAAEHRRTRVVLTPVARAGALAHGVAPTATTALNGLLARMLPSDGAPEDGRAGDTATTGWRDWFRRAGSHLNERAAQRYNQATPHEGA
ncbi:SDR family oxidoreductase [Streptomyces sp. NPDC005438]|uniref:SDR family NAD(P)-dependent oxidoreductase n=1 Tax=Streptomyces sp. NPDC005438 TaxID=3156880 RepID=UPI0033B117D9